MFVVHSLAVKRYLKLTHYLELPHSVDAHKPVRVSNALSGESADRQAQH